jgi:prepilin-type N-terminal cleavage/methylation domain-containing protein
MIKHNPFGTIAQRGFTVIEVVVAIVLAGIFIIGLTVMVNSLNVANTKTRRLSLVNAHVESMVENLRNAKFVSLPADGTTVDVTNELPDQIPEPRSASYTITNSTPALKQINITVTYNDYGSAKTIRYATAIGELGVGQY